MDPKIALLHRELERAYDRPAWHGPNLRSSLKSITPEIAAWRPGTERHNIWELAVHAAYWKYRACRLLSDAAPRAFGVKGSNFPPRPVEETEDAWRSDLELLQHWHDLLLEAVVSFDPARLGERPGKSDFTFEMLISGVADHDIYHAGQIRLIHRLWDDRARSNPR